MIFAWGALALLHAVPSLALFRPTLLSKLYAIEAGSVPFVLVQHRAALFCCVSVVCIWAAVRPETRSLASVVVGISMFSFLILYGRKGRPRALRAIALADLAGLPLLAFAAGRAFGLF